jgi:hypothetical protein
MTNTDQSEFKTFQAKARRKSPSTKRKPRVTQLHIDSLTRVNPVRTHGLGLWGNRRVVFGVRVDEELKKRFNLVAERVFGSTCNPVESFMAAVVGCYQNPTLDGVNPSITIGEIRIERNLRERRKLVVGGEVSESSYARMDRNLARLRVARENLAPVVDYSKLSLEELQKRYDRAVARGSPDALRLAIHLKKRELKP